MIHFCYLKSAHTLWEEEQFVWVLKQHQAVQEHTRHWSWLWCLLQKHAESLIFLISNILCPFCSCSYSWNHTTFYKGKKKWKNEIKLIWLAKKEETEDLWRARAVARPQMPAPTITTWISSVPSIVTHQVSLLVMQPHHMLADCEKIMYFCAQKYMHSYIKIRAYFCLLSIIVYAGSFLGVFLDFFSPPYFILCYLKLIDVMFWYLKLSLN